MPVFTCCLWLFSGCNNRDESLKESKRKTLLLTVPVFIEKLCQPPARVYSAKKGHFFATSCHGKQSLQRSQGAQLLMSWGRADSECPHRTGSEERSFQIPSKGTYHLSPDSRSPFSNVSPGQHSEGSRARIIYSQITDEKPEGRWHLKADTTFKVAEMEILCENPILGEGLRKKKKGT